MKSIPSFVEETVNRSVRRYRDTAWWSDRGELAQQLRFELLVSVSKVGEERTKSLANVIARKALARHVRRGRLPVSGDFWHTSAMAHVTREDGDDAVVSEESRIPSPEQCAIRAERDRMIRAHLDRVCKNKRDVEMYLLWAQGVELFKLAYEFGYSVGTVGNRIRQLRQDFYSADMVRLWMEES